MYACTHMYQMGEEEYHALVSVDNVNRTANDENAAASVEGALALLGVTEKDEKHPEK